MNLIVREFVHFPFLKNEMRGFVFNRAFNALTQLDNLAYFPEHREGNANVEEKVKSFVKVFIRGA